MTTDILDRVRTVITEADQQGHPRPTNATLAQRVKATERDVYHALVELDKEQSVSTTQKPEPLKASPKRSLHNGLKKIRPTHRHVPWPLVIIGMAAAVAVWSGWVGLGQMTGFGVISLLPGIWDNLRINTAVVLPLSVEAYAAYALHVWLGIKPAPKSRSAKTKTGTTRTLRFARNSAIGSLIVGGFAQVAYHLMSAAGYTRAPWPIVMLVAIIPVAVLGLASALAKLASNEKNS